MSRDQEIEITDPNHLLDMGRTHGLLMALDAIQEAAKELKLPGLGVALHAVKAAEAEQRVLVMQKNIRAAVKAGVDLDERNIYWDGRPYIWSEPIPADPTSTVDEVQK